MHLPKILFHQSKGRQALRPQADQAHAFGMYPEEVVPNLQSERLLHFDVPYTITKLCRCCTASYAPD